MRALAAAINDFADAHRSVQTDVNARITEANARLEAQKNRLAALMSDLSEGVLVCNSEGRILLYNARAKELLDGPCRDNERHAPIGLGRSIFAVLDKQLIVHALDTIRYQLDATGTCSPAHVITARDGGELVRANMAPILDRDLEMGGFVLVLDDITDTVEINSRRDALLRSLIEGTRASLANIRAAVETMLDFPAMPEEDRGRFVSVISDEALTLSTRLAQTLAQHADTLKTQWPMDDMASADLLAVIRRRIASELDISVDIDAGDAPTWLTVDSYAVVRAMLHAAALVIADFHATQMTMSLRPDGRFARLELRWAQPASTLDIIDMAEWERQRLRAGGEGATLRQVLERHGVEGWCRADRHSRTAVFCLQLPTAKPGKRFAVPFKLETRPEFYDFDLFNQPGQRPELDERALADLSYTVFDTETTGLDPSGGDEIISIGAVRIINGRLLKHETFDQLIDTGRPLSQASIEVHGITAEMLVGQPRIDAVLPAFHRFAEDTILVAHNAAFDMRFLQLKEASTGIKFIQPVLDTLLLSAVAHPSDGTAQHSLEAIAQRFGVDAIGRHTALGDAMVTGEIFLKLIPLLAAQGIRTLKDAREASCKTLYAKLEY